MRTDKDVFFNYNLSVTYGPSRPRVKVGDYRRSDADRAVISNRYVRRMYFINVDKLANPDVASHHNSAQPLQPRSQTKPAGSQEGYPTRKPIEQKWQNQRLLPLIFVVETLQRCSISSYRSADRFRSTFSRATATAENSGMSNFFDTR